MKSSPTHVMAVVMRRMVQLGVFLFVAYAAMGGYWRNYKVAHNNSRLVGLMHGDEWATLYATNEDMLSTWDEPYEASLDFLGMPWSATVFGVETADPILMLAHVFSTGSVAISLVLSALLAVGLAALFGKVFCSHICPMRTLFDVGQAFRSALLRLRIPLPTVRLSARFGGWVLIGGLLATVFAGMTIWYLVLPYLGVVGALFLAITSGTTAGLLSIVVAWWLTDTLFAPGLFCHNLCPQGFLLEQFGRLSLLQLRRRATPCPETCHACSLACPFSLSPRDNTHTPACNNCGQCVGVCPERKLARRFALPIVSALALSLVPTVAEANHNKGLPHYGYFENYPQVPTENYVVVDGNWEMGATVFNFQGYDRTNSHTPNDVKFYVYIFDLERNENYVGAVDFEIVLGGEVVSRFTRERIDEELTYSTRETLPQSGTYELVAHIRDPDTQGSVSMAFDIDVLDEGIGWGMIAAIGVPITIFLGLAVYGAGKRGRARRMKTELDLAQGRAA